MRKFLRIGGAQLPVSNKLEKNVVLLKEAIDWAAENQLDYLVTPEASLSGYIKHYDKIADLKSALTEIEEYSKEKSVGLCLGTLWTEEQEDGTKLKRNQIRVYYKGQLLSIVNKTHLAPLDYEIGIVPSSSFTILKLIVEDENGNEIIIPTGGMICRDLFEAGDGNLPMQLYQANCVMNIHSTTADRGISTLYDKVFFDWHNASFQLVSFLGGQPLITVDSCNKMGGAEYDKCTSSPSGVLINGEWVVQAPTTGKQYFFHDIPLMPLLNKDWGHTYF
jgi:predicted amidohydrolase